MNLGQQDVERIVRQVMEELRKPAVSTKTESAPAAVSAVAGVAKTGSASAWPAASAAEVVFDETIITAELLNSRIKGASRVRIAPRAIVTPSARDFLRTRGIEPIRARVAAEDKPVVRWQAVISQTSPHLDGLLKNLQASGQTWCRQLVGTPAEAAKQAVSAICRGEAAGVVAFADQPELVACLVNRHAAIRAAVVSTVPQIVSVKRELGANVLVIRPQQKSFFELRNLVLACTAGGSPQLPAGWQGA